MQKGTHCIDLRITRQATLGTDALFIVYVTHDLPPIFVNTRARPWKIILYANRLKTRNKSTNEINYDNQPT